MATLEELNMALQTVNNTVGLRRDMRSNAIMAKSDLVRGVKSFAAIADEQNRNADQYIKRLDMQSRIANNAALRQKLASGLLSIGADKAEIAADLSLFRQTATALRADRKTTQREITDSSDRVLTAIPRFETIFGME